MARTTTRSPGAQLSMPGLDAQVHTHTIVDGSDVESGREVMYLGKVAGGPRYGSHGTVKRALLRRAVIDMGRSGTWYIPYYFLALPQTA